MEYLKNKEAEYRENQIGTQFLRCPNEEFTRIFIHGEILTAEGFSHSELFISYKFSLPPDWKTELSEQNHKSSEFTETELLELNCLYGYFRLRQSITHSVTPVVVRDSKGSSLTKYYFSFPLDLQLVVKDKALELQWPILHFEVFEKDFWERIYMHGCGFINIPSQCGTHFLQTQTWRPDLDNKSQVSEFFLGGLIRPNNIQDISRLYDVSEFESKGPINRSQFKTISSGKITIRLNVATQSKKVKTEERFNNKTIKRSEQTEIKKQEFARKNLPSQLNTGLVMGGRYTNSSLLN